MEGDKGGGEIRVEGEGEGDQGGGLGALSFIPLFPPPLIVPSLHPYSLPPSTLIHIPTLISFFPPSTIIHIFINTTPKVPPACVHIWRLVVSVYMHNYVGPITKK